jgi:hypothetical protein
MGGKRAEGLALVQTFPKVLDIQKLPNLNPNFSRETTMQEQI